MGPRRKRPIGIALGGLLIVLGSVAAPAQEPAGSAAPSPPAGAADTTAPADSAGTAALADSPDTTAAAREREERELERVRKEIELFREKARDLRGREAGLLGNVDQIEREIALQDRLLSGLLRKRERITADLERAQRDLERATLELARRRRVFLARLREMYKLGRFHEYEVILGSRSFVDLVRRYDYLLTVASRDRQLHEGYLKQLRLVAAREEALRRGAGQMGIVEEEAVAERDRLLERREERIRLLSEIKTERRAHEAAIEELEESAANLRELIVSLEERREFSEAKGEKPAATGAVRSRKGSLLWPAEGTVLSGFGKQVHPEFGTETFSNGVDIRATAGTPIRCVAPGSVDFVSSLPGYGNCIIVNHGDGFYTLYAHASEVLVKPGSVVEEGQTIARVGSTGSFSGDLLHFEIRDGRKPVDPLGWLKRR